MSRLRVRTYRKKAPDGGELVSEYGPGWQRAYHIPKALLDYWKKEAKIFKPKSTEKTK